jgi:uncharacterized membrane protein
VSKLVETSFKQLDIELAQISSYDDLTLERYLGIIVDSQMYDQSYIEDLGALSVLPSLIYLKQLNEFTPKDVKYSINKPFLPTDFIVFINNIIKENEELKGLHIKPKEDFFDVFNNDDNDDTEENAQTNNNVLKEDDIEEIKDIFDDDLFGLNSPHEEADTFKDYEKLEEEEKETTHIDDFLDLDTLSEDDIQNALEKEPNDELLQPEVSFEVVKDELKQTIEHSVTTLAMQSNILRETLKGLKMNIIITFEDK